MISNTDIVLITFSISVMISGTVASNILTVKISPLFYYYIIITYHMEIFKPFLYYFVNIIEKSGVDETIFCLTLALISAK